MASHSWPSVDFPGQSHTGSAVSSFSSIANTEHRHGMYIPTISTTYLSTAMVPVSSITVAPSSSPSPSTTASIWTPQLQYGATICMSRTPTLYASSTVAPHQPYPTLTAALLHTHDFNQSQPLRHNDSHPLTYTQYHPQATEPICICWYNGTSEPTTNLTGPSNPMSRNVHAHRGTVDRRPLLERLKRRSRRRGLGRRSEVHRERAQRRVYKQCEDLAPGAQASAQAEDREATESGADAGSNKSWFALLSILLVVPAFVG